MVKYIIGIFVICLTASIANAQSVLPSNLESKVDELVQQYLELDIFSGVVLVAEKGKPVYHKAFGMADRNQSRPNNLETRFDIGSMNKAFTKVVILQLISEGKLGMDDLLGKYLEGFPPEMANHITIRHLLEHRSGLDTYHSPDYWDLPLEAKNLANTIKLIKQEQLWFEPGTHQQYSNSGYVLLGAVIEQVTGHTYFDEVENRIVQKLGMKNTFLREKYNIDNRAIGYTLTMRGDMVDNDYLQEVPTPAGGFYSTASDLLTFFRAYHYGEELWSKQTKQRDNMYAFYQEHTGSGGAMTHAGGFEGANTVCYEILRDQVTIIVLANMEEPVAEKLGAGILAITRNQEPEQASLPAICAVYQAFQSKGIQYIEENFDELTTNFHPEDPKDIILNRIGYNLLYDGITGEQEAALEIFALNTKLFPSIANCWDSLGEAWRVNGNKQNAIKAYSRALELQPGLPSAEEALQQLKAESKKK